MSDARISKTQQRVTKLLNISCSDTYESAKTALEYPTLASFDFIDARGFFPRETWPSGELKSSEFYLRQAAKWGRAGALARGKEAAAFIAHAKLLRDTALLAA